MPINVVPLRDAERKAFKGKDPSPVKSTKTYSEAAELIRNGQWPTAAAIKFSPEELAVLTLKTPYTSLGSCLRVVINKYCPGVLDVVSRPDHVAIYRTRKVDGGAPVSVDSHNSHNDSVRRTIFV